MSRATEERKTRQLFILAAARRVFAARGIENSTMEDIAAAAEYNSRRSLYGHFKSRDEICLWIHVQDLTRRWRKQRAAIADGATGLDRIRIWAETLFAHLNRNPQAMRMEMYWDYHGIDPGKIGPETFARFETLNDQLAAGLREIFHAGIQDGSLRPDLNPDLTISQFLYSLRSVIARALSPGYSFARFDPEEYFRHYLDLFCRGIQNQGEKQ